MVKRMSGVQRVTIHITGVNADGSPFVRTEVIPIDSTCGEIVNYSVDKPVNWSKSTDTKVIGKSVGWEVVQLTIIRRTEEKAGVRLFPKIRRYIRRNK